MVPSPYTKTRFVQELAIGTEVAELFLIGTAQQLQAKNGPYWRLEFRDATGSIGGKIWSPQSAAYPSLAAGQIVLLQGRVGSYRDVPELTIDSLDILTDEQVAELDLFLFMRASRQKPQDMLEELQDVCRKNMPHKPWRKFAQLVLTHEEIALALLTAPAAKAMHHAYAGGLLEHTLSVCKLSLRLAEHYPQLDKQVLLAGALCHDLGKLWELSGGLAIDYTQEGRLIGHISQGLERLTPLMRKAGLEPELIEHLQHLILSHHGTLEFGSPRLPATAEAIMLHYADNIDAKMQQVETALADLPQDESGWSGYVPSLERALFRAMPSPQPVPKAPAKASAQASAEKKQETSPHTLPLVSQCSLLLKE